MMAGDVPSRKAAPTPRLLSSRDVSVLLHLTNLTSLLKGVEIRVRSARSKVRRNDACFRACNYSQARVERLEGWTCLRGGSCTELLLLSIADLLPINVGKSNHGASY